MRRRITRPFLAPVQRASAAFGRDLVHAISAHPRRAVRVGAICLILLALVATTTLPMALAPTAPGLARMLNAHDPDALMPAAEAARAAYLALSRPPTEAPTPKSPTTDTGLPDSPSHDTLAQLPEAVPPSMEAAGATLRKEEEKESREAEDVRRLAAAITAVDPLNPVPFRMRAEVTTDRDQKRSLMLESAKRSRRDAPTIIWLFEDDLQNKHYEAALNQADILFRTQPQLQSQLLAILGRLAEDPKGRPALVQWLARDPQWRLGFFQNLNRSITRADTPFKVMQDLQQMGHPPTEKEINQYLSFLLAKKFPGYAYNVWLQTLPADVRSHVGFLINPSFEQDPSGGPFDWTIAKPSNAIGEIVPLADLGGQRVFHVMLGPGRVRFPQLSQTLSLPPGSYRLEGKIRGSIVGKRGLVWEVRCLNKPNPPLGQSEPLLGQSGTWRLFSVDFQVPEAADCAAQTLRLFHDARSASEELVTGEAWFDDLSITRIHEEQVN